MSIEALSQSASARSADPAWAWKAYQPDAHHPWNLRWAGHLYRRAGFGPSWKQLQQALADGPQTTIDRLLHPAVDVEAFNRTYDEYEAGAASEDDNNGGGLEMLRDWWLRRILQSPHPLLEKMTLFWHNHFAVSGKKVASGMLMQRHVKLLRSQALGNYRPLLAAVVRDPAVLVNLNVAANRRYQPSATLARRLLEAYALGPGNYSEEDVREAARALTGWFVSRRDVRYVEREHDTGTMRILGRSGQFGGDDLVRIVLEQSAASRLIVRKLYRWLISEVEEPSEELIAPLVEAFGKDYDIARLAGTLLRSNLFFSPVAYRQRIKSPVEFGAGIVKAFGGLVPTAPLVQHLAALGQSLGDPPTLRGWEGGRAWINPFTLVGRGNLAATLLSADTGDFAGKLDVDGTATNGGAANHEAAVRLLLEVLLQDDLPPAVRAMIADTAAGPSDSVWRLRRIAYLITTLPEYELA